MKLEASWRKGFPAKVEAQVAAEEFEEIRGIDGEIRPEDVLKRARDKDNPLHDAFEWSNSKAATQWRLQQARGMIGAIEVRRIEQPQHKSRMYEVTRVSTPQGNKPTRKVYKSTEDILADPVSRDALLMKAINDALAYRKRYHMLSELSQVIKVMDDFVENADKMIA